MTSPVGEVMSFKTAASQVNSQVLEQSIRAQSREFTTNRVARKVASSPPTASLAESRVHHQPRHWRSGEFTTNRVTGELMSLWKVWAGHLITHARVSSGML